VLPDFDALSASLERRVRTFGAAFEQSPDHARRALRALLGGERIRI
jgi:hypothetical protein